MASYDDDDHECRGDKYHHSSNQGYASYLTYDTDDDDDGAYIEINFNPSPTQTTIILDDVVGNRNFDKDKEQLAELRISFSAGISPTVTTCLSSTTQHVHGTIKKPRLGLFVSLTRIVNAFMTSSTKNSNNSLRVEGNNVDHHEYENGGADHLQPISKADCTDMLCSRKDHTMVASKHNSIINLIVKFKYRSIPSMLVSMVTPKAREEQVRTRQPLLQRGSSSSNCSRNQMNDNMNSKTRDYSELDYQQGKSNSSVAGIVKFKAIRGVLEALRYYTSARIGTSSSANKHSNNKSKSCPGSIKSSPMHCTNNGCDGEVRKFYSRDNSVQAAIAHCKKSLGPQAEFEFLH